MFENFHFSVFLRSNLFGSVFFRSLSFCLDDFQVSDICENDLLLYEGRFLSFDFIADAFSPVA